VDEVRRGLCLDRIGRTYCVARHIPYRQWAIAAADEAQWLANGELGNCLKKSQPYFEAHCPHMPDELETLSDCWLAQYEWEMA
jgi:hypothetical protein